MSKEIEIFGGGIRGESPYERLKRLEEQNYIDPAKIPINIHYTDAAGSDPATMEKIAKALADNLPFGLKCNRSRIIFIPHKLKAYWIWSDGESGPTFTYADKSDLINGVKMQYLSHKDFITTAELAALSKIILLENALENLESWRPKILPESAKPSGPLEPGAGGI